MSTIDVRLTPRGSLLFAPAAHLGDRWDAYCDAVRALRRVDKPAKGHGTRDVEVAASAVAALQAAGFSVRAEAGALARLREGADALTRRAADAVDGLAEARARLAERGLVPRPYQEDGIRWLRERQAGLLADDMGLGKTMQVLLAAPPRARVLVVCPASVVGSWLAEAAKWRPDLRAARIEGTRAFRWPGEGEVLATSHDALGRMHMAGGLAVYCFEGTIVVVDEAHACKSLKSQRTQACRAAARSARKANGRAWLLTGTPVQNRPDELRAVLETGDLFREAFGSWRRFCDAFGGPEAVSSPEAQPSPAVAEALARVSLRRLKSDVATDLPPKFIERRAVPLAGCAAELAAQVERAILARLEAEGVVAMSLEEREAAIARALEASSEIGEVAAARKMIALAKLPAALEEVERCEATDEPLVVATAHRDVAEEIGRRLGWGLIVGGVPQVERDRIVAEFQAGRLRGVALTIRAGGTGLTLTRACRILFVDRDWNPAQNAQTEDRIHRIGQWRPCTVVALVGDCWIEERVEDLCGSKGALAVGSLAPLVGRAPIPVAIPDLSLVRPLSTIEAAKARWKERAAAEARFMARLGTTEGLLAPDSEPPRQAQQEAPGAAAAAPAGDGWLTVDDVLRGRLERLAASGHPLGRWLLSMLAEHGRIPGRCAPRGQPKRATLDLVAEAEACVDAPAKP